MLLTLQNGYPYPYPLHLTSKQNEEIDAEAASFTTEFKGVVTFQWLHTVTIGFDGLVNATAARDATGWEIWGGDPLVLEAKTSGPDGYDHPAIIVGPVAYCGFILSDE
jgi:hypothetical protein